MFPNFSDLFEKKSQHASFCGLELLEVPPITSPALALPTREADGGVRFAFQFSQGNCHLCPSPSIHPRKAPGKGAPQLLALSVVGAASFAAR